MTTTETWSERFWARIDTAGDGCWEFRGKCRSSNGYGVVAIPSGAGRNLYAHRVAWELTNGPIPHGLVVRHTCDNPPCCRPAHLLIGTRSDNCLDAVARGRHSSVRGPVPDATRWEIHAALLRGETQQATARKFGVSQGFVGMVAKGHRGPPAVNPHDARVKLSPAQRAEIRAVYAAGGVTQAALAAQYGVTNARVNQILR